jgi:P27 family predicted phage terminase small subunit
MGGARRGAGRKPKPTVLHRLHGTLRTRHASRAREPVMTDDIDPLAPPADLSEAERASWQFAIAHAPRGVLKSIDTSVLRIWVEHEVRYILAKQKQEELNQRTGLPMLIKTKSGDYVESPYVKIMNKTALIMLRAASELGFTPVARPRLTGSQTGSDKANAATSRWTEFDDLKRKAANG